MKGLIIQGPGQIGLETLPDPELHDARGAVVKINTCSICGSDMHLYHAANGNEPFCIGHEAIGEVVETGRDVAGYKPGDRVLIMPSVGCGGCAACARGETILCENAPRTSPVFGQGQAGLGGCQAQAVAVPAADCNLRHMDSTISDGIAMLLCDSMATAWFCARRGNIAPGDTVAVIGMGPIGQQAILAARAMGATRIIGVDPVASRRDAGTALGAETIPVEDAAKHIKDMTDGRGVDVALDAAGGPDTTALSVRITRKAGCISVIGVSESAHIPFPAIEALVKNLDYRAGLCSIQAELPALLAALEDGRLKADQLEALITHTLPMSQGADAYAMADRRDPGVGKLLFDPSL